jgi:hypothetical protein
MLCGLSKFRPFTCSFTLIAHAASPDSLGHMMDEKADCVSLVFSEQIIVKSIDKFTVEDKIMKIQRKILPKPLGEHLL